MKKLKLIFGLLLVAGFIAITVLSYTSKDSQAILKSQTIIPRNVRLAEAPSFGLPIIDYDPKSKGAEAYFDLAEEFLDYVEDVI